MAYKLYLWDSYDAIGWSQAAWRVEQSAVSAEACTGERIHDVMLRYLPRDGVILDAGCGTAKWPIFLRQHGYRCVGVDISLEACRLARRLDPGLPLAEGDTRRAPIRTAAADAVLSLGVVEHDETGPVEALRELHRVLKPGGLLILSVPYNNPTRRLIMNRLQTWVTWRRRRAGMTLGFSEYRFTKRELRGFLAAADFEVVSTHPNELYPPKVTGLWVDWTNLVFSPFHAPTKELFVLPGWKGRLACAAVHWVPWLVCGEVVFVAKAR
ncbi:MAG: class I SAM-dependent methyltransferase [Candidatus Binatia bacterium]